MKAMILAAGKGERMRPLTMVFNLEDQLAALDT